MRALVAGLSCGAVLAVGACGSRSPAAPSAGSNIVISGPTSLEVGRAVQYTAATDAGQDVTVQSDWTSSDRTVATTTHSGLVTALATGPVTLSASYKGTTRTLTVTVTPSILRSPSITACGTITASGDYVLDADITQPNTAGLCLTIAASGVRVDGRGHGVTGVSILGATDVVVSNCNVAPHVIVVKDASNVRLDDDTAAAIELANGRGNQVTRVTIDGGYDGSGKTVGSDDGILLIDQTNARIEGNTIRNVWDAGIEGVDVVAGATIANNIIVNAGASGVSSYWCTSWTGNLISGNSVTRSSNVMYVGYMTSTQKCAVPLTSGLFLNNRVIGNVFRDRVAGGTDEALYFTLGNLSGTAVSGNVIQNNDLGDAAGPYLNPPTGFVNGGGNICRPGSSPFCG
jgi:parallel beta-helix repeat protein